MIAQCILPSTDISPQTSVKAMKSYLRNRIGKLHVRMKSNGVHSFNQLRAAGFRYNEENGTFFCEKCRLEVVDWPDNMDPLTVHSQRSPDCEFLRSLLPNNNLDSEKSKNPTKRRKIQSNSSQNECNYRLKELAKVKEIRCRTFSHWRRQAKPSAEQFIAAGFFACNVGDRVICIYCNLICQQWLGHVDDPTEVHKTLSPRCPFVLSMLTCPILSSTIILNDTTANNRTTQMNNMHQHQFDQIVYTRPCHEAYSNVAKRLESFATWSQESTPAIDDFVRAGFFYTGASNIVTCFYCNGSLQNWTATDNPVHEHARWFRHCPYAKQLCGEELHRKIQEANRIRQERQHANQLQENDTNTNQPQLQTNDTSTLSRLVAARLDLPNSQRLLDQPFKLSVIKRCWEDQFQLKKDDFASDCDLLMACIILQKQIDLIQGNRENIIIPHVRMKLIREGKQTDQPCSNTKTTEPTPTTMMTNTEEQSNVSSTEKTSALTNPCIVCFADEKRLACLPCGHFSACVPCSHSLRTCPVCRRGIEAFVRVYI